MSYQAFLNRVRNDGAPSLVFLYGEERFFRDRVLQQIINQTVPADARDFNLTVMYGKEVTSQRLVEERSTFPVFAERRLIIVKEAHAIPAAELEKLGSALSDPVPETVVVFVADKIDKRKKFFQQFRKLGELVEFKPLYDNQIPDVISTLLKEFSLTLTEAGMAAFCRRVGTNLQEIASELEKLKAYAVDGQLIDKGDVEQVVTRNRQQSVFDLADALGRRRTAEALRIIRELIEDGEAPVGVLSMMVRHFRQLWKISDLLSHGVPQQEFPKLVGVNPYFVKGLISQSRNFTPSDFRSLYREFLQADLALKSSGAHPSAILERITLLITNEKRPA